MGGFSDFLWALWSNTVSLWSGIIGIVFAGVGLLCWSRNIEQWKWFVLAGGVAFVVAPSAAWFDEHSIRMELEKVRPYVVMKEVPAEVIRAYSLHLPGSLEVPNAIYQPAWFVKREADREVLMFSVKNSGDVTARGLRFSSRIGKFDALGVETNVPLPELGGGGHVLTPKDSVVQYISVPKGTFFSEGEGVKSLLVRVAVTYSGQPSDNNLYFYRVVLRVRPHSGASEGFLLRTGGVEIESSDEGVVTNLDDLLR